MDGSQYDLFLMLLEDYELKGHKDKLLAAQRLQQHHGLAGEDYSAELEAIEVESQRRAEDKRSSAPYIAG